MKVEVVYLPSLLKPADLEGRAVVVFDVLRATTTMAAALAVGISEIRIFGSPDEARAARAGSPGCLLCGEINCLPPADFDLGNSPGGFSAEHCNRIVLMATTNGTRAILAAKGARRLFVGALANASAVARVLIDTELDVTLLCAGTNGQIAMEDILGAGAVIDALSGLTSIEIQSDTARMAHLLFVGSRDDLVTPLFTATGGRNVVAAGLPEDVAFAAQLDRYDMVGEVLDGPLRVVRAGP